MITVHSVTNLEKHRHNRKVILKCRGYKFEVRPSNRHGYGIFCTQPIRKGEYIGRYTSRISTRDGTYVLWVEVDGKYRGYNGFGPLKFLNHSKTPNADFRHISLYATKSIKPGDEIVIDYGDEWKDVK